MTILRLQDLQDNDIFSDIKISSIEDKHVSTIKKSNFTKAFLLLPKEKRIAISNFYLFCAYIDDIVDNPTTKHLAPQRIAH